MSLKIKIIVVCLIMFGLLFGFGGCSIASETKVEMEKYLFNILGCVGWTMFVIAIVLCYHYEDGRPKRREPPFVLHSEERTPKKEPPAL